MEINGYKNKSEYVAETGISSTVYLMDCMDGLKQTPDNYYSLCIVDPPYGIKADYNAYNNGINCKVNGFKEYKQTNWDNAVPSQDYFTELFRVSKNQIIWGGNYFTEFLPPVMSWIIWDKMQYNFTFSDGEMAWYNGNTKLKIFRYARGNESGFAPKLKGTERSGINIHPTQKPIQLYKWLLTNYAKQGDTILDTHLGSGSSRIAADQLGFDFTGYELDKDYYDAQEKRFKEYKSQLTLEL